MENTQPARFSNRWNNQFVRWIWIILPLLGLAFFLYRNTHESVWVDEAYTMGISSPSISLAEIWHVTARDYNPPLFYYLLWLFRWVFGPSIFVARLFSALSAFGLLLLGAGPFRRACGNKAALIFMALAVLAPAYVAYAQDIRMYSMAAFAVFGMAVYLQLAIRDGRRADWVKAFLFTILALYVHIYAILGAFFVGLYSLLYVVFVQRKRMLACVTVLGLAAAAFLPWVFILYGQFQRASQNFWIPALTRQGMMEAIAFPFGLKFGTPDTAAVVAAILFIASVVGIFLAMRKARTYALSVVCLLAFFSTMGFMFLISSLVRPFIIGRYMLPLTGLLLAAGAYGLAQLRRVFVVHVGVIIMVCEIPLLISVFANRYNGPMTEIVAYMKDNLRPGDVIVHTEEHSMVSFSYYFPNNTNFLFMRPESIIYMDPTIYPNGKIVTDLQGLNAGGHRVWVIRRAYGANYAAYLDVADYYGLSTIPEGQWGSDFGSAKNFSLPLSWSAYFIDASPSLTASTADATSSAPSASPSSDMGPDLQRIFSGVSIQSQDDFSYTGAGPLPQGWTITAPHSMQIMPENQALVHTTDPWTVFYYEKEMVTPQKGIAFSFQYAGASDAFTLGIDAATPSGEKIPPGPDFYSIALKMENSTLSAHAIQQTNPEKAEPFQGGLTLTENTWYDIALGFNNQGKYIIQIWEPDQFDRNLTYICDCHAFPTTYYFVGYMSGKRSLRLDNFTIFDFQDILA
jgi:hypothetical protein